MKKLLITFATILIGFFILMSVLDSKGEYLAGRSFWLINRQFNKLSQRSESVTAVAVERQADKYRHFLKKYPNSQLSARAQMAIGSTYRLGNNIPKARQEYAKVSTLYPNDKNAAAEALAAIAGTYEAEGKWPTALKTYKQVFEKYPLTDIGFQIPLLLARHYQSQKDADQAAKAYQEARVYYRSLTHKYPESMLGVNALRVMIMIDLDQEKWEEALEATGEMINKYPTAHFINQGITIINQISVLRLKNYDLPISIYQNFIDHHPQHPANKLMLKMIDSFRKLKAGKVDIKLKT